MPSLHRIRARDASKKNDESYSSALEVPRTTVRNVVKDPQTPEEPRGRLPTLDTPIRKRLIQRATIDRYHRKLCYLEVAALEGIQACKRTLQQAFEKELYFRRVATEKPLLTEKHMRDRLEWALTHLSWDQAQWARVIWTDECSIICGYNGQV